MDINPLKIKHTAINHAPPITSDPPVSVVNIAIVVMTKVAESIEYKHKIIWLKTVSCFQHINPKIA